MSLTSTAYSPVLRPQSMRLMGLPLQPGAKGDGWKVYCGIAAVYALSQLWYLKVMHVQFFTEAFYSFWQYLDLEQLRTDLWTSLWYLHAQPPLMNLIIGVVIKIWPVHFHEVIRAFYMFAGWPALLWLYQAMRTLGVRKRLCWLMVVWLCAFPTMPLFTQWPYTTHLEFTLCALFALRLARVWQAEQITTRRMFNLCVPLGVLELMRPQWHPVVVLVPVVVLFLLRGDMRYWRAYVAGWIMTQVPIMLVFTKNLIVFGFFGASSWTGSNMVQIAESSLLPEQYQAMVLEGVVDPSFPRSFYYERVIDFHHRWMEDHEQPYYHRVLGLDKNDGWANWNSAIMPYSARLDMHDTLVALRRYPNQFLEAIWWKIRFMSSYPAIAHDCCGFTLHRVVDDYRTFEDMPEEVRQAVESVTFVFYTLVPLGMMLACLRRKARVCQWRNFLLPALLMAALMFVLSCAINNWEQERMRWGQVPLYVVTFALWLEVCLRVWQARLAQKADADSPGA
ncbi:MAG: hypothetical protein EBV03_04820 [Proteobacteria bacterium]|nr:hypothetical protein [Pseudomonadota bacterium]